MDRAEEHILHFFYRLERLDLPVRPAGPFPRQLRAVAPQYHLVAYSLRKQAARIRPGFVAPVPVEHWARRVRVDECLRSSPMQPRQVILAVADVVIEQTEQQILVTSDLAVIDHLVLARHRPDVSGLLVLVRLDR